MNPREILGVRKFIGSPYLRLKEVGSHIGIRTNWNSKFVFISKRNRFLPTIWTIDYKDVMDALQGRAGGSKKLHTLSPIIPYDAKPLTQAKDQASWLEKWLSSAVGEKVKVEPIVTIPGWFVKRTSPAGMADLNPKKGTESYITSRPKGILSEAMITRIVHQIDQRCRNVEPKKE